MHIHANNSLQLAAIGVGREEVSEIAARRAAEVRKKLASAARMLDDSDSDGLFGPATRVERRSYEAAGGEDEDGSFGRIFSAKA
jgi:hypothetical protein